MKRYLALTLALVMILAAFSGCGGNKAPESTEPSTAPSTAPSGEPSVEPSDSIDWSSKDAVHLRLGHTNAETDSRHTAVLKFADLVEERTGGKVTVEVYGGGVLGTAREMVEGLQVDMLEIVVEGYNCMSYFTDLAMDTLPFIYDNYDHFMASWYDSDVGDTWISYAEDVNFEVFAPSYRGFRIVTSTKSFTTADEVVGLRIRTPTTSPFLETWQALETQATPMSLSEVLTGLQQGTIEAQENPVSLSYNYGFYDVCDYIIKTNHVCGADIFMMDKTFFDALDADVQAVIKEAAEEVSLEVSAFNAENESAMFDKFAEQGCTIVEPDVESFRAKLDGFVGENFPQMQEIVDMIAAVEY